jgi:hypothetical protein
VLGVTVDRRKLVACWLGVGLFVWNVGLDGVIW